MSPVPAFNENSDIAHEIAKSLLEPNAEARRASRRGGKTDAFCRKAHRRRCRVAHAHAAHICRDEGGGEHIPRAVIKSGDSLVGEISVIPAPFEIRRAYLPVSYDTPDSIAAFGPSSHSAPSVSFIYSSP